VKRLEAEGAALDIGAYRDAPAGLRVWCGATVETADILAMLPWLEWAYRCELDAQ
jgi:phosphoserine aminotransferase